MCIAGSRIHHFKDSGELLQHLENQPMNILKSPESDQYFKRIEKSVMEEEKSVMASVQLKSKKRLSVCQFLREASARIPPEP